jgi:demethylsterigmatocystin 6-O-methyltransferase
LFSYTNNTDLNFFQWLQQRPEQHAAFNASMAASVAVERAHSPHGFADLYPFESEIGPQIASAEEVAIVDVGGGYGHVLEDVKRHIPGLKGRLIVQDLPETVAKAKLSDGIEAVAYDFFADQQPIKGGSKTVQIRHDQAADRMHL